MPPTNSKAALYLNADAIARDIDHLIDAGRTVDRCWRVLEAMERAAAHCTEADGDYGKACERYARLLRAALEDKLA